MRENFQLSDFPGGLRVARTLSMATMSTCPGRQQGLSLTSDLLTSFQTWMKAFRNERSFVTRDISLLVLVL